MTAPVLAVAEHHEAYFAWKQADIRGAWCWHVDAHLDVSRDGLGAACLQALSACETLQQAEQAGLCGNSYVPWGGLNCGNFLLPALTQGILSRLTWVLPPDLAGKPLLSWARLHLQGWLDVRLQDYASLEDRGGYIEGTLEGVPFQMGCREHLPVPTVPVLVDIDLDYFLNQSGEVWTTPEQLPLPASQFTTLAFSIRGGYLSDRHKSLALHYLDELPRLDPEGPLDVAARKIRAGLYDEALRLLESPPAVAGPEHAYLRGTSLQQLKRYAEALECWESLLLQPLPEDGRASVLGLCSQCLLALGQPGLALERLEQVTGEAQQDYRRWWAIAHIHQQLEHGRAEAQALRRALALSEDRLFGLQVRYQLACLYRKQGKEGLARMELARLQELDRTNELRSLTLLR